MTNTALDAQEVTFEDVTFHINKMLPQEAKALFIDHVRPLLGGALDAKIADEGDQWQILLAMFTNAPAEHYHAIVNTLYRYITYARAGEPPKLLAGDTDFAFQNLDMAHILILEVRAFWVNFRESCSVVLSEFPHLGQAFQSLTPST